MPKHNLPFFVRVQSPGEFTDRYHVTVTDLKTESSVFDVDLTPEQVRNNFEQPVTLPFGSYSATATAIGPEGETSSEPMTFSVLAGLPSKPSLLIIGG